MNMFVLMLVASIYRRPNSDRDNNEKFLNLMQEIGDLSMRYKILLGTSIFQISSADVGDTEHKFIEKIRDCYLTQYCTLMIFPDLGGKGPGSILDLLLSNEESIIEDLQF